MQLHHLRGLHDIVDCELTFSRSQGLFTYLRYLEVSAQYILRRNKLGLFRFPTQLYHLGGQYGIVGG